MINMQILQQLQSLGKRLDTMEEKTCKKTSDQTKVKNKTVKKKVKNSETPVTVASENKHLGTVPDLNTLRQDALIQLKVEERLKQLQESDKPGKIKSLGGGGGGGWGGCVCVLKCWSRIKSSGPTSTSSWVRVRNVFPMISCLSCSGWLAFAAL